MKIYIVTKGVYSDCHICGVAVDLKEMERLQNINTDEWDMARIETYDTMAFIIMYVWRAISHSA